MQDMQRHFMAMSTEDKARMDENLAATQPLREASSILAADPPPNAADLAKAIELSRKAVDAIEARSLQLPPEDAHSLYWMQVLDFAWSTRGWAALETKDFPTAETYLSAAWHLNQDQMAGYKLGRVLEAKGDKAAAAHLYELASVTNGGMSDFTNKTLYPGYNLQERIHDHYLKLTGKPLTATSLNHGQYNGSLRAELDKEIQVHGFTRTSKLNGQALFILAYEAGKPVKASLLQGDKGFASMASLLEGHRFGVILPSGSKARLLREVRLICSSYGGGCDAYMLLPTAVQIPAKSIQMDITPPNAPKGTKTVQIELHP